MKKERKYGEIHPGINWGPFTLRVPGVHVGISPAQNIQGGLLLLATGGATAPLIMQYFDVPFEIAWTMLLVMFFWILMQNVLFGDVYSGGGISPALPLTIVFLGGFTPGTEAIQAMIAVTMVVAVLFLFFGVTKLGEKFNELFPAPLKAGIIMGAAIAAFQSELNRLPKMPVSLITAWVIVLVLMYSIPFAKLPNSKVKGFVIANALLVGLIIAGVVGAIVGEVSFDVQWGFFLPQFGETLATVGPWSIGFPSWSLIVAAIPLGVMTYVLSYGDLLVGDTILKEADKERPDEKIDLNMTRSHYVMSFRHLLQLVTAGPLVLLHGPIWTGLQVFIVERYKKGRKTMDSIFSGTINAYLLAIPIGCLLPVIGLIVPVFPIALSLTLLLTGFACAYVAMSMVHTNISRGLTIAIGMLTAFMGPAWGIGAGFVLYYLIIGKEEKKVGKLETGETKQKVG